MQTVVGLWVAHQEGEELPALLNLRANPCFKNLTSLNIKVDTEIWILFVSENIETILKVAKHKAPSFLSWLLTDVLCASVQQNGAVKVVVLEAAGFELLAVVQTNNAVKVVVAAGYNSNRFDRSLIIL